MAPEYTGKVRFAKANVSESPDTAARFMVMGIPTVAVLRGGETLQKVTGGQSRPKIEKLIALATG